MSWQTDALAEQDMADTLWEMGEAEWRDVYCDEQPCYNKIRRTDSPELSSCTSNIKGFTSSLSLSNKCMYDLKRDALRLTFAHVFSPSKQNKLGKILRLDRYGYVFADIGHP